MFEVSYGGGLIDQNAHFPASFLKVFSVELIVNKQPIILLVTPVKAIKGSFTLLRFPRASAADGCVSAGR